MPSVESILSTVYSLATAWGAVVVLMALLSLSVLMILSVFRR
jgi:hypothetical protein